VAALVAAHHLDFLLLVPAAAAAQAMHFLLLRDSEAAVAVAWAFWV
jgi:hypothetical protein